MPSSSSHEMPTRLLLAAAFAAAGIAMAVPAPVKPNVEGLQKCLKLHPERFCRIENGYSVPVPAKAP